MQKFNLSNLPKYWMVEVNLNHPFLEDFNKIWKSFNLEFSTIRYKYCGFDNSPYHNGYHGCNSTNSFLNSAILLSMDDFERLVTPQSTANLNYSIF